MARNSLFSREPPSDTVQAPAGVTYYEATTGSSTGFPILRRTSGRGGLARVNPEPLEVMELLVTNTAGIQGTFTRLVGRIPGVSSLVGSASPYGLARNWLPSADDRLLLYAEGFDEIPGLAGHTFPCRIPAEFGGLIVEFLGASPELRQGPTGRFLPRVDAADLFQRALQDDQQTPVIGRLGVPFLRVHNGDPQGAYSLAWTPPTNGPEPDYYNVYQRSGQLWSFVGSTSSTEITIDNILADPERGPPVNVTPLSSDVLTHTVPEALPAKNFVSPETFPDGFREIQDAEFTKFPQCSTFFEQRQCFGGSRREPETVHMSKTAQFRDFSFSQPRRDDDAIYRELSSGIAEEIRHMVWLTDLLIFTSRKEYRLRAPTGGAVTPNTISASPQSFYGTSHVAPVLARDKVLVAERGGKEIRDFKYDFDSDTFSGDELTILAPHLFANDRIRDMDYHEGDTSLLFVVTDNGRLFVQTKDDALEINGWTEWTTNKGMFRGVSVLRSANNTSSVMFSMERRGADNRMFHSTEFVEFEGLNSLTSWTDSSIVAREYIGRALVSVEAGEGGEAPTMILSDVTGGVENLPEQVIITGMKQTGDGSPAYTLIAPPFAEPTTSEQPSDAQPPTEDSDINGMTLDVASVGNGRLVVARDPSNAALVRRIVSAEVDLWKPVERVTGLDHLEGRWVSIGVDGKPLARRQVSGGEIVLDETDRGREVNVGLEYTMEVKTLPVATYGPEDGAFYASTLRCSRIIADVGDTDGMRVAAGDSRIPPSNRFKPLQRDKSSRSTVPIQASLESPMTRDLSLTFVHGDPTPATLRWFSAYINSGDDG